MSPFRIGGPHISSTGGVSKAKKPEMKAEEKAAVPPKGQYDTVKFRANRLAVMPRISVASDQSAQRLQGENVESLLKDSATELDRYFSKAYGFDKSTE